jgi:hypothetical protein
MPRKTTGARTSRKAKKEPSPTEGMADVVDEQGAIVESIEVVENAPMETERDETSSDHAENVEATAPEPEPAAEEIVAEPLAEMPKTRKRAPRKKKEPITQEVELSIPVEVIPPLREETKVEAPAVKKRGGRKKAVKNVVTQARSRFGWCEINGIRHEHDLIVKADGTVERRDKSLSKDKKDKYGHVPLTRKELKTLLDDKVKLVFIGTGQSGGMPITPKAGEMLEEMNAVVKPTPDAIEDMLAAKEKFVALIHVTC